MEDCCNFLMKNIKFFHENFDLMFVTKNCYEIVNFYVKSYLGEALLLLLNEWRRDRPLISLGVTD